jgi:transposase
VRWQPHSAEARWFEQKFAHAGRRQRRVGIVAVARKLVIALWRYACGVALPQAIIGEMDTYRLKAA